MRTPSGMARTSEVAATGTSTNFQARRKRGQARNLHRKNIMVYKALLVLLLILLPQLQSRAQDNGYWIALGTTTYDQSNLENASISTYVLVYKDQRSEERRVGKECVSREN